MTSNPLIEVDRAIAELRRGALVRVYNANMSYFMIAVDALTSDSLNIMQHMRTTSPKIVLTTNRLKVLGLEQSDSPLRVVSHPKGMSLDLIEFLANPLSMQKMQPDLANLEIKDASSLEKACVSLSKYSRLLPAALIVEGVGNPDIFSVQESSIQAYTTAQTLTKVSEARVPLENAENVRIVAFRPRDGGTEHLAIVIGDIITSEPTLVRLHSECFTGDLVGSLRCDCGNQLRGAIREMAQAGRGVLLYLAQEGRGIGLVNKLRAYQLQDAGFDTVDANIQLGFDPDERNYLPAAQMLEILGVSRVKLMTNNPAKMNALSKFNIEVVERVPHIFPSNRHNEDYLNVKAAKSGHLF
jgi:GTP cyclohydrolase II